MATPPAGLPMAVRAFSDSPRPGEHTDTARTTAAHNTTHTDWQSPNGAGPHFSTPGHASWPPHAGHDTTRVSGQGSQHTQHNPHAHWPLHTGKHTQHWLDGRTQSSSSSTFSNGDGPHPWPGGTRHDQARLAGSRLGWLAAARPAFGASAHRPATTYWYGVCALSRPDQASTRPNSLARARESKREQERARKSTKEQAKASARLRKQTDAPSCNCIRMFNALYI